MTMTNSPSQKPSVLIASDHAGFELKQQMIREITNVNWVDLGPADAGRVDYPDFADRLSSLVSQKGGMGVLICGSGQGMAIRANRHPKVRAALAWNEESALLARQHNDANILCLGARLILPDLAKKLFEIFITTPFEGGRHEDRVKKLDLPC
jgi:ribose 5-phosphate isomerase B